MTVVNAGFPAIVVTLTTERFDIVIDVSSEFIPILIVCNEVRLVSASVVTFVSIITNSRMDGGNSGIFVMDAFIIIKLSSIGISPNVTVVNAVLFERSREVIAVPFRFNEVKEGILDKLNTVKFGFVYEVPVSVS